MVLLKFHSQPITTLLVMNVHDVIIIITRGRTGTPGFRIKWQGHLDKTNKVLIKAERGY